MKKCQAITEIESRFSGGPARKPATKPRYADHAKGRCRVEFSTFLAYACKNMETTKKFQKDGCLLGQRTNEPWYLPSTKQDLGARVLT